MLPRLPSGASLWPGTFFKRCKVAGYTDRQPRCIFFATQFPRKLSMLLLYLFPVSSMEKCSQEPCLDTVLTLKTLSFIYWCLSSLPPRITSEFTDEPLAAVQSTLNPITARKLDQYMKGQWFWPLGAVALQPMLIIAPLGFCKPANLKIIGLPVQLDSN